jgi:hypothetical protein
VDSGQASETKNLKVNEGDGSKGESGYYDEYAKKVKKPSYGNKQKVHPISGSKANT